MWTIMAMAMVLQQAPVVWETPPRPPEPTSAATVPAPDLPAWALADPFAWERAQCSPLLRGATSLEACQARARGELSAALGSRLPAGLRPPGEPVPCLATPDESGAYPIQCGLPERAAARTVTPRIADCRTKPTNQGGAVAFVTECEPEEDDDGGLTLKLWGKD